MLIAKVREAIVVGECQSYNRKTKHEDESCGNPCRDTKQDAGHVDTSLSSFWTGQNSYLVRGAGSPVLLISEPISLGGLTIDAGQMVALAAG